MPKKKQIIDAHTGEVIETSNQASEKLEDSKAVIQADPNTGGIVSLTSAMSSKDLKAAVKLMTEQRKIIADFVKQNLVEGVDYGTIESTSKSGKSFKSKPTLYKPGMEKIFSLFGLSTELNKDAQTVEMLSNIPNLVAYKCDVTREGQKIAEGRGAAVVGDMGRDANATIKIAEKRARMDGCLALGFSEYFTQDMDDPDYKKDRKFVASTTIATPKVNKPEPVTDKQRMMMYKLMNRCGINSPEAMKATLSINDYPENTKDMTKSQASEIISRLINNDMLLPDKVDSTLEREVIYEDIPDSQEAMAVDLENAASNLSDIEVTEEMKEKIAEKYESLDLAGTYKIRFLKEVTNQISLRSLTDEDWINFDMRIEDVLNEVEVLPGEYFKDRLKPEKSKQ